MRGWLKVRSDTDPPARILEYSPWQLLLDGVWETHEVRAGRGTGTGVLVRLADVRERDRARRYTGADIAVHRDQLPELESGEHYWCDLLELEVVTCSGQVLGRVERLMATGANDVLVVRGERERLIPFLPDRVVTRVDAENGRIEVDWDPEF